MIILEIIFLLSSRLQYMWAWESPIPSQCFRLSPNFFWVLSIVLVDIDMIRDDWIVDCLDYWRELVVLVDILKGWWIWVQDSWGCFENSGKVQNMHNGVHTECHKCWWIGWHYPNTKSDVWSVLERDNGFYKNIKWRVSWSSGGRHVWKME